MRGNGKILVGSFMRFGFANDGDNLGPKVIDKRPIKRIRQEAKALIVDDDNLDAVERLFLQKEEMLDEESQYNFEVYLEKNSPNYREPSLDVYYESDYDWMLSDGYYDYHDSCYDPVYDLD